MSWKQIYLIKFEQYRQSSHSLHQAHHLIAIMTNEKSLIISYQYSFLCYHYIRSVQFIIIMIQVLADCIELAQNNTATIVLNVPNIGDSVIFKVKSNIQEAIEAKPTHGVITNSGQMGKTTLHIRYKGKVIDIDKAKLKVYWLPIPTPEPLVKLKSHQIAESYKQYREEQGDKSEQSLTLLFSFRKSVDQQPFRQFRYKQHQQNDDSSIPIDVRRSLQQRQSLKIAYSQTQFKTIPNISQVQKEEESQHSSHNNSRPFLWLIILSFLIGITFGIKIGSLNLGGTL